MGFGYWLVFCVFYDHAKSDRVECPVAVEGFPAVGVPSPVYVLVLESNICRDWNRTCRGPIGFLLDIQREAMAWVPVPQAWTVPHHSPAVVVFAWLQAEIDTHHFTRN